MYETINQNLERRFKKTEFPLNVAIEITNYCNLNCIMCNNDKLTRPKGYINMFMYKKIIDEVAQESPNSRIWLDYLGEPMLAGWKLYYMIDYAKKKGCTNICINSNGLLWTHELSDMMLDSGVDYISLDCDGYTKEVYEAIRRGGNRDIFYSNIEYLLQEKKRRNSKTIVDVKVIEMEENKHEVDQIMQYWRERGAWTAVRRCITWCGKFDNGLENGQIERIACGNSVATCAISWDGNVVECPWDSDARNVFGNIANASIKEIWAKRNKEFVDLHLQHRWDELSESCRNCTDWMIIGENRYDENGKEMIRKYDIDGKLYESK